MKTLLNIAILLLCVTQSSYSQNISISDFLSLRINNNIAIETLLTKQDFSLYDEFELGNGRTHITYQSNHPNTSDLQWIDFVYEANGQWNNRVSFQTQEIEQVKNYLTELKKLGFYFNNKKIVDRQIFEVYTNGINTVELITSQSKNAYQYDNTMYFNFAIYNASEYSYSFASENKKYSVPQVEITDLYASLVNLPIGK